MELAVGYGPGPNYLDSLSRELSSEPANWRGGIRQPPQTDEEDRNKPHPVFKPRKYKVKDQVITWPKHFSTGDFFMDSIDYYHGWQQYRICDNLMWSWVLDITAYNTDHNIWAILQSREIEDFPVYNGQRRNQFDSTLSINGNIKGSRHIT